MCVEKEYFYEMEHLEPFFDLSKGSTHRKSPFKIRCHNISMYPYLLFLWQRRDDRGYDRRDDRGYDRRDDRDYDRRGGGGGYRKKIICRLIV